MSIYTVLITFISLYDISRTPVTRMSISTTVIQRNNEVQVATLSRVSMVYTKLMRSCWLVLPGKARFPSGMRALTDQIHALGLWVSLSWVDKSCFDVWMLNRKAGIVGSPSRSGVPLTQNQVQRRGMVYLSNVSGFLREWSKVCSVVFARLLVLICYRDAKLFQEKWGFDYLKYDNCGVPFDNITRQNIMGRE